MTSDEDNANPPPPQPAAVAAEPEAAPPPAAADGNGDGREPLPPDAAAHFQPANPATFFEGILQHLDLKLEIKEPELSNKEQLGIGGTGVVYVAEDDILGRPMQSKRCFRN